ncbi:hypothetical protein BDV18DRAFT_61388 [Aspergillus unguis]
MQQGPSATRRCLPQSGTNHLPRARDYEVHDLQATMLERGNFETLTLFIGCHVLLGCGGARFRVKALGSEWTTLEDSTSGRPTAAPTILVDNPHQQTGEGGCLTYLRQNLSFSSDRRHAGFSFVYPDIKASVAASATSNSVSVSKLILQAADIMVGCSVALSAPCSVLCS